MNTAKDFYKTMWNPLYEETDHPQFSYKELIEFADEYHKSKSQESDSLPCVSVTCTNCKYLMDNGKTEHIYQKYTCVSDGNNVLSPNDYSCGDFEKQQK